MVKGVRRVDSHSSDSIGSNSTGSCFYPELCFQHINVGSIPDPFNLFLFSKTDMNIKSQLFSKYLRF